MKPTARLLSIAVVAALALSAGAALAPQAQAQEEAPAAPQGPPPAPVSVAEARSAEIAPLMWAPGSVVSREDARVASEQDGRVTEVAEIGTDVRKGDALARLDDAMLRLQERQNLAEIARIDAQLDYARSQEERLAQLVQKASIAGSQLDEARSQRRVLEQELQRARVSLDQTRHRLRNATVRAPFDGVVAERFIQAGEYLGTGMPVVRLVNTHDLEVRVQAPVHFAERVQPGMQITLRADGEETRRAVRAVVPVGDESTRQFELRIALGDAPWTIGRALEVGLPSDDAREVVAVPRDALLLRANETFVLKVAPDDTAQRIPVRTGSAQGDLIEVIGDVASGDRLVIRGGERLAPGQRIRIEADPDPEPEASVAAAARLAAGSG